MGHACQDYGVEEDSEVIPRMPSNSHFWQGGGWESEVSALVADEDE